MAPFKCAHCVNTYESKNGLLKHLRIKHPEKSLRKKRYFCCEPNCDKGFPMHKIYVKHLSDEHAMFVELQKKKFTKIDGLFISHFV